MKILNKFSLKPICKAGWMQFPSSSVHLSLVYVAVGMRTGSNLTPGGFNVAFKVYFSKTDKYKHCHFATLLKNVLSGVFQCVLLCTTTLYPTHISMKI